MMIYIQYEAKYEQNPALSAKAFQAKLAGWWPALKGSLSHVRKPCIRPDCAACASGQKHLAYMLAFTDRGRRRCMYVPARLAPLIRKALRNGRRIEQLLAQVGPALLYEQRQRLTTKRHVTQTKSGPSSKKSRAKS